MRLGKAVNHGSARGRIGRAQLLVSALAAAVPTAAAAQSATQIVPPTREEVLRPVAPTVARRAPRLEVEGGIERAPCALDGPDFASIRFVLRGAQFEGLKGVTAEQLSSAYSPYVGRDVPISIVCEIRDRAATILRDAGYIAAVQVPEQRIADGTVNFRVLMARLTQVRVRGDASGAEQVIAGYLNQLTKQPVFNRHDAERYLLLASDLPGYSARLTLRPAGTVPGEVIGDVTVQRQRAYADINVQNGGSEELGRWGVLARGQVFGLTGLADRTTLSLYSTADFKEQQTVQLAHDFRLGSSGLSISNAFTYAWAHPSIANANVRARTALDTIEVGYPLVRRQSQTIRGSFGMDLVDQVVRLNGLDLSRDRLSVGFLRLATDASASDFGGGFSEAEPKWRMASLFELRKGMHIFGATQCGPLGAGCIGAGEVPTSRIEGRSDAAVFRATSYGEYRPIPRLTFALTARGQYAWKPLLSFEEFSAGNYTAGRGYDPGSLLGDMGFGTQAEVRLGSRLPQSAKKPAIEGYGFWDHAMVRNHDQLTVVDEPRRLNSAGVGARATYDRFMLDAGLAFPLNRIGVDRTLPGPRFLISLTSRLWPWSYQ